MGRALTAFERLARAGACIQKAEEELSGMRGSGRERTYKIVRARRWLRESQRRAYGVLLSYTRAGKRASEGERQEARELLKDVRELWPGPETGREKVKKQELKRLKLGVCS